MPDQSVDEFGLPIDVAENETSREALWRRAKVKHAGQIALARLFSRLKFHLGLHDAQALLNPYVKKQVGRPRGSGSRDKGLMLLALYDEYMQHGEYTREAIAFEIFETSKTQNIKLGNSPQAIAEQIGVLLKDREARRKEADAFKAAVLAAGMAAKKPDSDGSEPG